MTAAEPAPMDEELIARMTGRLGDPVTIENIARDLALSSAPMISQLVFDATGNQMNVSFKGVERGMRSALIGEIDETTIYCTGSIKSWCLDIEFLCGSGLLLALIENLLGGTSDFDAAGRRLSEIELDVSIVLFEQVIEALKRVTIDAPRVIGSPGRPNCGLPELDDNEEPEDFHAVKISLELALGANTSVFDILVPQSTISKTTPLRQALPADTSSEETEWKKQLSNQVIRSTVALEADIQLSSLSLGAVSRMQVGDVIPFHDEKDVRVLLKANGKELYWCEFGKSGQRYMVRLSEPVGTEPDDISDIFDS